MSKGAKMTAFDKWRDGLTRGEAIAIFIDLPFYNCHHFCPAYANNCTRDKNNERCMLALKSWFKREVKCLNLKNILN